VTSLPSFISPNLVVFLHLQELLVVYQDLHLLASAFKAQFSPTLASIQVVVLLLPNFQSTYVFHYLILLFLHLIGSKSFQSSQSRSDAASSRNLFLRTLQIFRWCLWSRYISLAIYHTNRKASSLSKLSRVHQLFTTCHLSLWCFVYLMPSSASSGYPSPRLDFYTLHSCP